MVEIYDVLVIFLDLTKAFDKVWHVRLLWKLQNIGIGGNLLKLLKSYLNEQRKTMVIDGCRSDCGYINAGVLQGSVLGQLFFLI